MKNQKEIVDCYCSKCKQKTHHKVLYSKQIVSDDREFYWATTYYFLECCGCDNISFMRECVDESRVDDEGQMVPFVDTYPYQEGEQEPVDILFVPYEIGNVYRESVTAYNKNCPLLAAAGFRATIEAICLDKNIKGKDLEVKVNNLQKSGHITKQDRDRLHSVRFLGNDSIHEMKAPDDENLRLVLEIINNTLNSLYVLDAKTIFLEKPIKDFNEFVVKVAHRINDFKKGDIVNFEQLATFGRRLLKEDKKVFEQQFEAFVQAGKCLKLAIHSIVNGKTQYVVI